ncbi:hypothetical protein D3C81_1192380 [compost metagenome]
MMIRPAQTRCCWRSVRRPGPMPPESAGCSSGCRARRDRRPGSTPSDSPVRRPPSARCRPPFRRARPRPVVCSRWPCGFSPRWPRRRCECAAEIQPRFRSGQSSRRTGAWRRPVAGCPADWPAHLCDWRRCVQRFPPDPTGRLPGPDPRSGSPNAGAVSRRNPPVGSTVCRPRTRPAPARHASCRRAAPASRGYKSLSNRRRNSAGSLWAATPAHRCARP